MYLPNVLEKVIGAFECLAAFTPVRCYCRRLFCRHTLLLMGKVYNGFSLYYGILSH